MAFRAYGIYYLFPLVAMASLSLSWRLVAWAGVVSVAGWWAAFLWVARDVENPLSWSSLAERDPAAYVDVFLSPDFVGYGNRIEETATLFIAAVILAVAVHRARAVFFAQVAAEQDRGFLAQTFGEYVPEHVARSIIRDRKALEPQLRRASVMCVDIAGFTKLTEDAGPEATIGILNAFFEAATERVTNVGGVVVDFSGDGFIVAFNAPIDLPDHERAALAAARALLDLVDEATFEGRRLTIRIGITTGAIAGGSVGGKGRRTYTVHGDTVNLAARLQDMAKRFDTPVLMDAETAGALDTDSVRLIGEGEDVRGRAGGVTVYGVA